MDDKKVASLIISALTEYEILDLELRPTEVTLEGEKHDLTVYRLDFAAKVKTNEGSRVILIEIQKAKFYTDIMRFRRYLGSQYSSSQNADEICDEDGIARKKALPLLSIYILGHNLEHNCRPVIRVKRIYTDVATGEELIDKDEFIESLTHDSVIIQIPELKQKRRNRLEQMLSVFDQAQIDPDCSQILHMKEDDYPEEYQIVLRRLINAIAEQEVRKKMNLEDDMISELESRDRAIAVWQQKEEKAREELDKEQLQKEEERRQKEEERRQKEEERRKKEQALNQAEVSRRKLEAALEALVASGKSREEAIKLLGIE